MQLGEAAQIAMGVKDVSNSFEFFKNLGFEIIEEAENPFDWIKLTDGNLIVFLTLEGIAHLSIVYVTDNLQEKVDSMDLLGVDFLQRTEHKGVLEQVLFLDPENTLVVSMFQRDPETFAKVHGKPNNVCGEFGGIAYPVADLNKAIDFWETLGFEKLNETNTPYPIARMSDGVMPIEIHRTDQFDKPSISYISSNANERLAAIQIVNPLHRIEFNLSGGGKLQTPEGQSILLLNKTGPH